MKESNQSNEGGRMLNFEKPEARTLKLSDYHRSVEVGSDGMIDVRMSYDITEQRGIEIAGKMQQALNDKQNEVDE